MLTVITGASSGVGAAIAEHIAAPGHVIGLVGRNTEGLEATAQAVAGKGGTAHLGAFDMRGEDFAPWLADAATKHGPLKAFYANAGVSAGPPTPDTLESEADAARLVDINLRATIAAVSTTVALMRTAPEGAGVRRIAIVASIAGLLPTPDLAVYSATKAGLIAYAHAIRPRLKGARITVTAVCPGFVTSPMSRRHIGNKPFEVSASRAAKKIVRATEAGSRTTVFPLPFALMATFAPLAPGALIDRLTQSFAATIEPDDRP
ncbi:MAG: SDR family NAD(P)-dependent oxidoreductase [Devosia sp.]